MIPATNLYNSYAIPILLFLQSDAAGIALVQRMVVLFYKLPEQLVTCGRWNQRSFTDEA